MPGHSRLARLLQITCAAQVIAALAWMLWRWPASPSQALAGAALVLLIAPLVLGTELLIASRVAGAHPQVPPPSAAQLLRAWIAESVHWYRAFCWRQPFRWRAEPDHLAHAAGARLVGVVLVHGFMCNRGFWTPWLRVLRERGHQCLAVNLEPIFTSIDDYAGIIDAAASRMAALTGAPPVLICHSMGGLAVRAWWRAAGDPTKAARIITIASPHQGTWLARFSRRPNGRQMRLESDWLRQLTAHEASRPLPPTTCWYSNCDNVVFPAATAALPRADNRYVAGRAHVDLAFAPEVIAGTLALLATPTPRRQGESFTRTPTEIG